MRISDWSSDVCSSDLGTRQPIATYGADDEYQHFTTGELQFTSNADSWGASWLKWVGGLYYLNSEGGYDPGYLRLVDVVQLPISNIVSALPPALSGPLDQLIGNTGVDRKSVVWGKSVPGGVDIVGSRILKKKKP